MLTHKKQLVVDAIAEIKATTQRIPNLDIAKTKLPPDSNTSWTASEYGSSSSLSFATSENRTPPLTILRSIALEGTSPSQSNQSPPHTKLRRARKVLTSKKSLDSGSRSLRWLYPYFTPHNDRFLEITWGWVTPGAGGASVCARCARDSGIFRKQLG